MRARLKATRGLEKKSTTSFFGVSVAVRPSQIDQASAERMRATSSLPIRRW